MADNLQGLNGIDLWDLPNNWKTNPKTGYNVSRILTAFLESKTDMTSLSDEKPEFWDINVSLLSKQEEFDFLTKFAEKKGRHKKFWFPSPQNRFTLKNTISSGTTAIVMEKNYFEYRGFERLFIRLTNGDRVSFDIASVVTNASDITINVATSADRTITKNDIDLLTLLHMCRLDTDEAELTQITSDHSELTLRVVELVKEYP